MTLIHSLKRQVKVISNPGAELVQLSPIPSVTAECGQQVVLRCDVSSSRRGLSIKHMEWSKYKTHLCSVNAEGKVTHSTEGQSGFTCEYEPERLTLIFGVRPMDEAEYRCKLRSNRGTAYKYARVELKGQSSLLWFITFPHSVFDFFNVPVNSN